MVDQARRAYYFDSRRSQLKDWMGQSPRTQRFTWLLLAQDNAHTVDVVVVLLVLIPSENFPIFDKMAAISNMFRAIW